MQVNYEKLFESVKQHIFGTIFNFSDVALKDNVILTIMNNGEKIYNILYNNVITATTPTTSSTYYFFMCDNRYISNLLSEAIDWLDFSTVLDSDFVNIDVLTQDNKLIPKSMIYGRTLRSGLTLIAIDSIVFDRYHVSPIDTSLTINVIDNRTVMNQNNFTEMLTASINNPAKNMLAFVNGYYYDANRLSIVGDPIKDWIELYIDDSVQFMFSVDLSHRKIYHSSEENLYKDIVLIPRELAGDKTYTYDTFNVIVCDDTGRGLMIPFVANDSVSQLTHNCIAISSFVIDAALDKLGVETGTLLVRVSDNDKGQVLTPNGSNTEQLYLEPDTTIITAMLDDLDQYVACWDGDNLEKNAYGKYVADMAALDDYAPALIEKQIECLGYYNFINYLCKHNGEILNLNNSITNLTLNLPEFWHGVDIYPMLYLNGNKIPRSRYTIVVNEDTIDVTFGVPLEILLPNSIITYQFIQNENKKLLKFIPGIDNQAIVLKIADGLPRIFLAGNESEVIKSIGNDSVGGYRELDRIGNPYFGIVTNNDEYVVRFSEYSYSNTFIITYDDVAVFEIHPDLDITDGHTLTFTPSVTTESGDVLNILTSGSYEIYFNGKFIVPGVDVCIVPLIDGDLRGGYQIVVQNLKFMKDTEVNSVEIYKTNENIYRRDTGYVIDNVIPRKYDNEAWIPGLSRLFINGKLIPTDKIVQTKTHFEIDPAYCSNGNLYHFVLGISNDVFDAYVGYMYAPYFMGRTQINEYFTHDYVQVLPDPIVVSHDCKIYSSFLNEIILHILSGEINVQYINDDTDILAQLSDYDYLRQFDTLLRGGSDINLGFVDIYPNYLSTLETTDLNKYLYINRLIKIILGSDTITDYTVVYQKD